jgi:hypothetical protein
MSTAQSEIQQGHIGTVRVRVDDGDILGWNSDEASAPDPIPFLGFVPPRRSNRLLDLITIERVERIGDELFRRNGASHIEQRIAVVAVRRVPK